MSNDRENSRLLAKQCATRERQSEPGLRWWAGSQVACSSPCEPWHLLRPNDLNLELIRAKAYTVPVVTAAFDASLCSSSSRREPGVEMLTEDIVDGGMRITSINT